MRERFAELTGAATLPRARATMSASAERLQVGAHVLADVGPHGQQDALALVVTGPVGVGLTESPAAMGPSTADDDLGQRDLGGQAGQHIAAADPPLGAHEPGSLQGEQDLLEIGLGERGPLGDVAHRRGRSPS